MGAGLTIWLEVYLPFRGKRFWKGHEQVAVGMTAGALLSQLALGEPELAVLVNGRNVPETFRLSPGDEVAILRHAEGG